MKHIVVFITASGRREADKIGGALLKKKLAACVNTVSGVRSRYWWKGKIESAAECLLVVKTSAGSFPALEKEVRRLHSYTVPEIIAVPVVAGSKAYLEWLSASVKSR